MHLGGLNKLYKTIKSHFTSKIYDKINNEQSLNKETDMFIVYSALNTKNNKYYIGITNRSLQERIYHHYYYSVNKYKGHTSHFSNALRIYSRNDWVWKIIDSCNTKEEAYLLEKKYINEYNSYSDGYNSTAGGEGSHGRKTSEETKKKISKKALGRLVNEETRKKLSIACKGRKLTDEDKAKKSEAARKRIYSNTKSGHTGVYMCGNKWSAVYSINRKESIIIGSYATVEEAVADRKLFIEMYKKNKESAMLFLLEKKTKAKQERIVIPSKAKVFKQKDNGNWYVFLRNKKGMKIWLGTFSDLASAKDFYTLFQSMFKDDLIDTMKKLNDMKIDGRINQPKSFKNWENGKFKI